jgi:galactofuranose transport system substrate-binding protein
MKVAAAVHLSGVLTLWLASFAGCSRPPASGSPTAGSESPPAIVCETVPPLARKTTYTIGFVPIYEPSNPWGITNTNDVILEAEKRGDKLVYSPFIGDVAQQVARMQALIDARVDAILLRPMDASALGPSVVAARKACIPVFTENRFVDSTQAFAGKDYVTGIGADPELQGRMVAEWLITATGGKATILEVEGTSGSSSAIGRKQGFDTQIATQQGMRVIASQAGDFERVKARSVVRRLLAENPAVNAIYAHADIMALGALAAVEDVGKVPGKDVIIVSIDGLKEAVQKVFEGQIAAVEFNDPRLAARAFDAIETYASGQPLPARIIVRGHIIDRSNAAALMAETF